MLLHPRFAVEQEKEDGSTAARAIDNMSWGPAAEGERRSKRARKARSSNGFVAPGEKMSHDTVDTLGAGPFDDGRGFLIDLATVPPVINANGVPFTLPTTIGELPFGWFETPSGTFDFSFPTIP